MNGSDGKEAREKGENERDDDEDKLGPVNGKGQPPKSVLKMLGLFLIALLKQI